MSKEGVQQFCSYFSAEDAAVHEPLFIAQYLLVPVNTIAKSSLLSWMMEPYKDYTTKNKLLHDYAKDIKAEAYLKYYVLVQYMHVVKEFGRSKEYNFEKDQKLGAIVSGPYGDSTQTDLTKRTLSLDSFMTIWLLTVPEKFKEWFEK